MACVEKRSYVNSDSLNQQGGWNSTNGDWSADYNQVPQITAVFRTPNDSNDGNWKNSGTWGNCSPEEAAYPGTKFHGCGDCSGGGWHFCTCCVTKWNENNQSKCCDPVSNTLQNDPVSCDPSWCPFSLNCEKADSTASYCVANFDDPKCFQICQKYISPEYVTDKSRPDWCDTFMVKYCAEHNNDSLEDQNLCACSLHVTDADECILPSCSSGTGVWMSGEQLQRVQNCGTICEQNIIAVKNHDVNISQNEFIMHCGGGQKTYCNSSSPQVCISLNSSGDPGGGGSGGGSGNNNNTPTDSQGAPFKNWWGSYTAVQASDGTVSHEIELSPMGIGSLVTICILLVVLLIFVYMNYRQNKLLEMLKSQSGGGGGVGGT